MKKKLLFALLTSFTLSLTSCAGQNDPGNDNDDSEDDEIETVERYVYVKPVNSFELLSPASYDISKLYFYAVVPLFEDNHISQLANTESGIANINSIMENGYFNETISLKAKTNGSIYFAINFPLKEEYKNGLRIELYNQANNKSVIYSFNGGESITEGPLDLDLDGQNDIDKDNPFHHGTGEVITYTTGSHSYNTEKFDKNPYLSVNENDEVSIAIKIYFDLFYVLSVPYPQDMPNIDLIFKIK